MSFGVSLGMSLPLSWLMPSGMSSGVFLGGCLGRCLRGCLPMVSWADVFGGPVWGCPISEMSLETHLRLPWATQIRDDFGDVSGGCLWGWLCGCLGQCLEGGCP